MRTLATALLAASLLASSAVAAPSQQWVESAQARAEAFWGGTKCPVTIVYKTLEPGIIARAEYEGCTVYLDPAEAKGLPFMWFCAVMVHEYGHIVGYRTADGRYHARNPRNVMFPTVTDRNMPRICKQQEVG